MMLSGAGAGAGAAGRGWCAKAGNLQILSVMALTLFGFYLCFRQIRALAADQADTRAQFLDTLLALRDKAVAGAKLQEPIAAALAAAEDARPSEAFAFPPSAPLDQGWEELILVGEVRPPPPPPAVAVIEEVIEEEEEEPAAEEEATEEAPEPVGAHEGGASPQRDIGLMRSADLRALVESKGGVVKRGAKREEILAQAQALV